MAENIKIKVTKWIDRIFVKLSAQTDSVVIIAICFGKMTSNVLIDNNLSYDSTEVLISLNKIW